MCSRIIVSHDRHFLDGLVTKVYEFGDGKVREHLGGIYEYLTSKNADNINDALIKRETVAKVVAPSKPSATESRLSYEAEKQLQKQRRKLERNVELCEQKVNELEEAISAIENTLSTPEGSTTENFDKYASLKRELADAEAEWEKCMEELETLE